MGSSGGAQIFYQQRGQALQERFVVENVFFNNVLTIESECPSGVSLCMLMYVRNIGAEQINVVAIYVNGTSVPSTGLYGTYQVNPSLVPPISDSIPAAPGSNVHEYMLNVCPMLNICPNLTTGSLLYIVVVSARGNRVTYTVRVYVPGT